MVFNLKKYFQIFLHLQKFNLMKKMAYPLSFLNLLVTILFVMFLHVLFIKISFGYITSLAGWTFYQVLAIVGTYMIIEGLMWILFANLNSFSMQIKDGSLDGILLKPIDAQFFVSFWRGDFEDIVRIVTGVSLLFLVANNIAGIGIKQIVLFLLTLFNGITIMYSFDLALRCLGFWVIEVRSLWLLLDKLFDSSQYPVDIYSQKIVRGIFTFVIPLAFVATVPAKMLTWAVIDWKFLILSFGMALLFFSLARWFWKFSLKHYSSASS